jgi:hypothetical protein
MDITELKELHDKAFESGQINRERAADDIVFYFITQWDDSLLAETQLAYRGEFNVLKKAGRQILSDLASNPVQIDFVPLDETRDDAAELADGLYRRDSNKNASIEAFENGKLESVVCGFGAWELYTTYVSNKLGTKNQTIKRRPIYGACNNVFWDPNAKQLDKKDAKYVSYLKAYSEDGYKNLVKELTGEEMESISEESFSFPDHSYVFPWISGGGSKIYVVDFQYREKIKEKILVMEDPFGMTIEMREMSLKKVMDEMIDAGYSIKEEKKIERWQVTKYIASGERILKKYILPGEHLTIIPCYGEHAYVEDEEHYEGVTRLAKDPQRLRNFQLSYLADIVSQSPRSQPIFLPEQIVNYEFMYNTSGIDNRYAYLLQNSQDLNGKDLPLGPVGVMPDQPIPQALMASIDISRQAIEDVANPGLPQDIADPDLSGKAVLALQARLDMQSMIYQEHYKHAKRRDGEIYASMAPEIYDTPRKEKLELVDGSRKDVKTMKAVLDEETQEIVYLNDLRNAEFEVYSKITASYSSQKEQTIDRLENMIMNMAPEDPMRKALQLKQLVLMDGTEFDDIRDYANMQLVLSGIKPPETPEQEEQLKIAQSQPKEPDAAMVLAKAEELKGKADIMEEKREGIEMQLTNENTKTAHKIDMFKAQTDRMKLHIEAQKVGADINKISVETFGKQLDNEEKIVGLRNPDKKEEKKETN